MLSCVISRCWSFHRRPFIPWKLQIPSLWQQPYPFRWPPRHRAPVKPLRLSLWGAKESGSNLAFLEHHARFIACIKNIWSAWTRKAKVGCRAFLWLWWRSLLGRGPLLSWGACSSCKELNSQRYAKLYCVSIMSISSVSANYGFSDLLLPISI